MIEHPALAGPATVDVPIFPVPGLKAWPDVVLCISDLRFVFAGLVGLTHLHVFGLRLAGAVHLGRLRNL